jgi:hypothetical protein
VKYSRILVDGMNKNVNDSRRKMDLLVYIDAVPLVGNDLEKKRLLVAGRSSDMMELEEH